MVQKEVILTKEGLQKLEEELNLLRTTRRKEIAEKIKIARGFGDLSENAEYDEAKTEQAQNEDRIMKLENMLRNAQTIDESAISKDKVSIGSKIKILDIEFDEELEYTIVGSAEADPIKGLISNVSPVGSALIGKKAGETVSVNAPGGIVEYKILELIV
ncbi:transcription elongation factor GreA [Microaceticoccus formicicus]|uniref:transcription elongation factor GreA n=1 Tax=Microaceticoccus formicicus TaxID=3118105 RepID=UPI003CD0187F|nr:transcription elongation factor GreA [Peptoniphilaceae bacterium AMB_02]